MRRESLQLARRPCLVFLWWYVVVACLVEAVDPADDTTTTTTTTSTSSTTSTTTSTSTTSTMTPTTTTTSAPPKKKSNVKLAALAVLVIPIAALVFLATRLWKRYKAHRMARELRLNGERKPGEVDDLEIGRALDGGAWLSPTPADSRGITGPDGVDVAGALPKDEFDPVAKQAAAQKERRARRRLAGGDAEGGDRGGDSVFSPAEGSSSSDGEEHGAVPTIYAMTMAPNGSFKGSPGDEGAAGVFFSSPSGPSSPIGAGAAVTAEGLAAMRNDPQLYKATSNVLMNMYHGRADTGKGPPAATSQRATTADPTTSVPVFEDGDTPPLRGVGGPTGPLGTRTPHQHRREASQNFESILTAAAAPLPVAADLRQRGDSHDLDDAGEDDVEEEEEEEEEKEEGESPPVSMAATRRVGPLAASASGAAPLARNEPREESDDEEYEYEYEEEEEEEEAAQAVPAAGRGLRR